MALHRVLLAAEQTDGGGQVEQAFDEQFADGVEQPAIARFPVSQVHEQVAQFDQGYVAEAGLPEQLLDSFVGGLGLRNPYWLRSGPSP